ncbi:MAG: SDR family oxidoreductase [Caulobacterales bacterium]
MEERNVIIVTGASGGLGEEVARRYAATHKLVVTGTSTKKLEPLLASLPGSGHVAVAVDLADPSAADKIVEAARGLGGFKALVAAAGMSPVMGEPLKICQVNLDATMRLERACLPLAGPGSVAVFVSSIAGHIRGVFDAAITEFFNGGTIEKFAEGHTSMSAYSASKRGVIMLAEVRATAWGAKGARVVSMSPGLFDTPMWQREVAAEPNLKVTIQDRTPLKRVGLPSEMTDAIEFLISEKAKFITGTDLLVDGGVTSARMAPEIAALA